MEGDAFPAAALPSLRALQSAFPEAPKLELQRFARARSTAPTDAVSMYTDYVHWRSDKGRPESLAQACSTVAPFVFSGVRCQGPANDGTGVIFMELGRYEPAKPAEMYAMAMCHFMDEAMPPAEDGQVTVIIDCRAVQGCPNPKPMDLMPFTREAVKVLPVMYPERLRRVIVYPVPWMATMLVNMVKKMLDPNTRQKLIIVAGDDKSADCPADELRKYISIDSLPRHCWFKNKSLDPLKVATSLDQAKLPLAETCNLSRSNSKSGDEEEDDFYSASEGEDEASTMIARPASKVKTGPAFAKLKDLDLSKADEDDLEMGPIIIGKEEKAFLLELLAEARDSQRSRCCCWWPFRCKICGHRRRHKQ